MNKGFVEALKALKAHLLQLAGLQGSYDWVDDVGDVCEQIDALMLRKFNITFKDES